MSERCGAVPACAYIGSAEYGLGAKRSLPAIEMRREADPIYHIAGNRQLDRYPAAYLSRYDVVNESAYL